MSDIRHEDEEDAPSQEKGFMELEGNHTPDHSIGRDMYSVQRIEDTDSEGNVTPPSSVPVHITSSHASDPGPSRLRKRRSDEKVPRMRKAEMDQDMRSMDCEPFLSRRKLDTSMDVDLEATHSISNVAKPVSSTTTEQSTSSADMSPGSLGQPGFHIMKSRTPPQFPSNLQLPDALPSTSRDANLATRSQILSCEEEGEEMPLHDTLSSLDFSSMSRALEESGSKIPESNTEMDSYDTSGNSSIFCSKPALQLDISNDSTERRDLLDVHLFEKVVHKSTRRLEGSSIVDTTCTGSSDTNHKSVEGGEDRSVDDTENDVSRELDSHQTEDEYSSTPQCSIHPPLPEINPNTSSTHQNISPLQQVLESVAGPTTEFSANIGRSPEQRCSNVPEMVADIVCFKSSHVTSFAGDKVFKEVYTVNKCIEKLRESHSYAKRCAELLHKCTVSCRTRVNNAALRLFDEPHEQRMVTDEYSSDKTLSQQREESVELVGGTNSDGSRDTNSEQSPKTEASSRLVERTAFPVSGSDASRPVLGSSNFQLPMKESSEVLSATDDKEPQGNPSVLSATQELCSEDPVVPPPRSEEAAMEFALAERKRMVDINRKRAIMYRDLILEYAEGVVYSRQTTLECGSVVEECAQYAEDVRGIADKMQQKAEEVMRDEQVAVALAVADAARRAASILQEQHIATCAATRKALGAMVSVRRAEQMSDGLTVQLMKTADAAVDTYTTAARVVKTGSPDLNLELFAMIVLANTDTGSVASLLSEVEKQSDVARAAMDEATSAADIASTAVYICSDLMRRCEGAVNELIATMERLNQPPPTS